MHDIRYNDTNVYIRLMRDFIVVPFEEWHFDAIELDGPEQKMIKNYGKSWADLVKCFKYVGATFSWYQDKKI